MIRVLVMLAVVAGLVGCSTPAKVEFRAASLSAVPDGVKMVPPGHSEAVYVQPRVVIGNADIASAQASDGPEKTRQVAITMTDAGAERLGAYTAAHVDQPIAIMVDGKLYSAPLVRSQISKRAMITYGPAGLSEEQVALLVRSLNK